MTRLGLDIGAVSVKLAALDPRGRLLWGRWRPHLGRPVEALAELLGELRQAGVSEAAPAAVTGSGRWPLAHSLGLPLVSEIRAQAGGALHSCPAVRTVIEVGGQDSKLIRLGNGGGGGGPLILEQAMNDLCAAGTGAFLERQAARLGVSLEEFAELAGGAGGSAAVAGRCAVFAQTDALHLRRQGRPVGEVAAGLCEALVRNLLGCLARGRPLTPPVSLQGGVAANAGVRSALARLLGLEDGALRVPEHYLLTGAIGAALAAEEGATLDLARALERLREFTPAEGNGVLPQLAALPRPEPLRCEAAPHGTPCFVGIDIGSVSAKAAAIDGRGRLIHAAYREARGEAAAEARSLLEELRARGFEVLSVAVTGSGRRRAAQALGAAAWNEIKAQARAVRELAPQARTLIEIGGQDAKLIRLDGAGELAGFEMNKVCAAGTGAFLEEQAARLGLSREALGEMALRAARPLKLGSRCTVFMESDLIHHQQRGVVTDDLAAGLCYAAAANYLEKVAAGDELMGPVAFCGGLAANPGVVAALGGLIRSALEVPAAHQVSGALGAAHLLRDEMRRPISVGLGRDTLDLFAERHRLLFAGEGQRAQSPALGLPRALLTHRHYPFWRALLEALGASLVLSPPTDEALVRLSRERAPIETCLPLRLAFGHAAHLLESSGVERLLVPVVREEAEGPERAWRCPYVQTLPHLLSHRFGGRVLAPVMPRRWREPELRRSLRPLAESLGATPERLREAVSFALAAQRQFHEGWRALAEEAVGRATPKRSAVVLGREYVMGDAALGREVPRLLLEADLEPLPHDALPRELAGQALERDIFWRRGRDWLRAAMWARRRGLSVLMLTCFGCGPDSFLEKYLRRLLGSYLFVIELDEHFSRAALETRVEAFADLARSTPRRRRAAADAAGQGREPGLRELRERTVFVPYAGEPFHALVAALRSVGLRARMLPAPDARSEGLGWRHCSGKECLPFIYHAGDLVRLAGRPGFEPGRAAVFVPGNDESCRVSQYARALRLLLERLGLGELAVFSPRVSMSTDEAVDLLGLRFGRRLWRGWVGIEALRGRLLRLRPYELEPGSAEIAYLKARGLLMGAVADGKNFWGALGEALRLMDAVPRRPGRRPRIAILGDYYLRANEFASRGLALRLEALGAEAVVAPFFTDYLRFQARERPRHLWRQGRPLRLLGSLVRSFGLVRDYARIAAAAGLDEPGPGECLRAAQGYLGPEVDRPPVASLGELAHYHRAGVAGVVNPLPLNCLYGTIATSAALAWLRERPLPFLTLTYDGQEATHLANRLEAFMDQVMDQVHGSGSRGMDGQALGVR